MMNQILKLDPVCKHIIWGGKRIPEEFGIGDGNVAEAWMLALHEEGVCKTDGGKNLKDYFEEPFPVMIKLNDAQQNLSVQVHPSKTEMWYVVDCLEGAKLVYGLKGKFDESEMRRALKEGTAEKLLNYASVRKGDVFFIPTGRIHALLPGSYVAEIQQTSDMTYRIYDYNRPGLDGHPRELHTELAKEAIDYHVYADYKTHYEPCKDAEVPLVRCPFFTTTLLDLSRPFTLDVSRRDSFVVLLDVGGGGTVSCDGHAVNFGADGCLLVPASAETLEFTPGPQGLKLLVSQL